MNPASPQWLGEELRARIPQLPPRPKETSHFDPEAKYRQPDVQPLDGFFDISADATYTLPPASEARPQPPWDERKRTKKRIKGISQGTASPEELEEYHEQIVKKGKSEKAARDVSNANEHDQERMRKSSERAIRIPASVSKRVSRQIIAARHRVYEDGDEEGALEIYNQIIEDLKEQQTKQGGKRSRRVQKDLLEVFYQRGCFRAAHRRIEEAFIDVRTAFSLSSRDHRIYALAGYLYVIMKHHFIALNCWGHALRLDLESPGIPLITYQSMKWTGTIRDNYQNVVTELEKSPKIHKLRERVKKKTDNVITKHMEKIGNPKTETQFEELLRFMGLSEEEQARNIEHVREASARQFAMFEPQLEKQYQQEEIMRQAREVVEREVEENGVGVLGLPEEDDMKAEAVDVDYESFGPWGPYVKVLLEEQTNAEMREELRLRVERDRYILTSADTAPEQMDEKELEMQRILTSVTLPADTAPEQDERSYDPRDAIGKPGIGNRFYELMEILGTMHPDDAKDVQEYIEKKNKRRRQMMEEQKSTAPRPGDRIIAKDRELMTEMEKEAFIDPEFIFSLVKRQSTDTHEAIQAWKRKWAAIDWVNKFQVKPPAHGGSAT